MNSWSLARFTEMETSWSLKERRQGDNKKAEIYLLTSNIV